MMTYSDAWGTIEERERCSMLCLRCLHSLIAKSRGKKMLDYYFAYFSLSVSRELVCSCFKFAKSIPCYEREKPSHLLHQQLNLKQTSLQPLSCLAG